MMSPSLEIRITAADGAAVPAYATAGAAGMDLQAFLPQPVTIAPMQRMLVPTGLAIELPHGFEAQIRPRSGLALKHGISMVNSPGTIDSDYRGQIGVLLINLSAEPFVIEPGMRIAQMVVARHETVQWQLADTLSDTTRGAGGFGHTGV